MKSGGSPAERAAVLEDDKSARAAEAERAADLLWASLAACSAAVLYAGFLAKSYAFEGLVRAGPIETERLFHALFNGNYLLYGFLGWCFHGLLQALGATLLSVTSLQLMDAAFGAAGLGLYFLSLRRLGAGRSSAFVWTSVLGFALGYWRWSTDAEDYIFSTFLLQLNFLCLLFHATDRRFSPVFLGLLHSLAVLGHIVNGLFGLVGVWFLARVHGEKWRAPVLRYCLASAAGIASSYGLALLLIIRPRDLHETGVWLLGTLARGPGGWLHWHGTYSLAAFRQWLQMTIEIVVSSGPPFKNPPPWRFAGVLLASARLLLAAFLIRFLYKSRSLSGPRKTAAGACCLWLTLYAAVFICWEPYTMVYRVSDLVPMMTLLFLGAEASGGRALWRAAAGLWALLLGAGNFAADVYPRSIAGNNPRLVRMEFIKAHTGQGDWLAVPEGGGGGEDLYVPFFAERPPILLGNYRTKPRELAGVLHRLFSSGRRVYVSSEVLADGAWARFFSDYRPRFAARDADGFELHLLSPRTGAE